MKKYIYTVLILSVFLLKGCDNNDQPIGVGTGKILHNGYVYQLHSAYIVDAPRVENGVTLDFEGFENYFHVLTLTGGDGRISANIIVHSISDRLESGEFHVRVWTVDNQLVFASGGYHPYFPPVHNRPNHISKRINLTDDFVHFAHNFGPSPKRMKLTITEEEGGIFDIELRYVECEGDFFIRYRGLIKDRWR